MSLVKANTYQDASGGSNAVFSGVANPPNSMGFRNRIINGNMVIDQRNAGAAVTITNTAANTFMTDRFFVYGSQASKFSAQQNAGSVTPPAGFTNYLGITSLSAYSITSGDVFVLGQNVEGFNAADFAWGTASAQTVTLSFWVRSSLTGTFGGVVRNSANNRSYPFSYTISSANTWEQKVITIAGDTTGTWVTNNGIGLRVHWGLGVGSTTSGTAGAWAASEFNSATGATSVVGTNGATFYITGVQLEAGTNASAFEQIDYGRELMLCQRYFKQINGSINFTPFASGVVRNPATNFRASLTYMTMRTAPTVTFGGAIYVAYGAGDNANITLSATNAGTDGALLDCAIGAGATTGNGGVLYTNNNAAGLVNISAEL
jgi:hypothetical protein